MARNRFPGKALKLNIRKRVKFREDTSNIDEYTILKIKYGLRLFNELFGDSDEGNDEFEGFSCSYRAKDSLNFIDNSELCKSINKVGHFEESSSDNVEIIDLSYTDESVILDVGHNSKQPSIQRENKLPFSVEETSRERKRQDKSERTSKKFILPCVSARSSRIIKPNAKFSDDSTRYSQQKYSDISKQRTSRLNTISHSSVDVLESDHVLEEDEEISSDPVCRSITHYTDSITEEFKGQIGRPSKRKGDGLSKEEIESSFLVSPSKLPKNDKVKRKIEKILKSPWNERLKQKSKGVLKETEMGGHTHGGLSSSKLILRKPKFNLSKKTLQKIRDPSSVKSLVSIEDDSSRRKCRFCQKEPDGAMFTRYDVSLCEECNELLSFFIEDLSTNLECQKGRGQCELGPLSTDGRCNACWLSFILLTCSLPSLIHDRLRKYLPESIKGKIPTSLSRSFGPKEAILPDSSVDEEFIGFGRLVDLPGGWKRKNGANVVVISPSGEKFRSVEKLADYLKLNGINVQASFLFGFSNTGNHIENLEFSKTLVNAKSKVLSKSSNVVVTTLPGGWTRRIKWRKAGGRFDTYVCSPDGRTFRSKTELTQYFQLIGKIDDINKYFPVKSTETHHISSNDNSESSCTEPSPEITVYDKSEVIDKKTRRKSSKPGAAISKKEAAEIEELLEYVHGAPVKNKRVKSNSVVISNLTSQESSLEEDNPSHESASTDCPSVEVSSFSENPCEFEEPGLVKHRKKKKKKKRNKHEKFETNENTSSKEAFSNFEEPSAIERVIKEGKRKKANSKLDGRSAVSVDGGYSLVCDVDKISTKVTEDKENNADLLDHNFQSQQQSKNVDVCNSSNVALCNGVVDASVQDKNDDSSSVPLCKNKPKKTFTTEPFGSGWSRKIRWNDKGHGKVAFLTNPEGQRIVSSIELLAYFKKAGKSMRDMDYYFPKNLVWQEPVEEPPKRKVLSEELNAKKSSFEDSYDANKVDSTMPEFSSVSALRKLIDKRKKERGLLLKSAKGKVHKNLSKTVDNSHNVDPGPRIKHVCRSQAQVLGMPRAVFPSPEKCQVIKKKRVIYSSKKLKLLSLTKEKKIFKKTMWCNQCEGCKKQCRKCHHCLDKKKFGGPGIKKKPCVLRKCYYPRRAFRSIPQVSTKSIEGESKKRIPANASHRESSSAHDAALKSNGSARVYGAEEKSIFIPKAVKPIEMKDKGDTESGKECIPGTTLNIDYWRPYDTDEMLSSGFPIITSAFVDQLCLCFRCGSAGLEELLYCIWCCEGIHPFCLEEGEGPECDEDEAFWVCRKCAVCHVCGGRSHFNLMQCTGCRKHYHLECLGPSSHSSCQPSIDGVWGNDVKQLLSFSWPDQYPLIRIGEYVQMEPDFTTIYEDLDNLDFPILNTTLPEWESCYLPSAIAQLPKLHLQTSSPTTPDKEECSILHSVEIAQSFDELESEEGGYICLEEALEEYKDDEDENIPSVVLPSTDEMLFFKRNVDLFSQYDENPSMLFSKGKSFEKDEYLSLGYSKIPPFKNYKKDSSLSWILRQYLREVFVVLGFTSVLCLRRTGLIPESYFTEPEFVGPTFTSREMRKELKKVRFVIRNRISEAQNKYQTKQEIKLLEEKEKKEMVRLKSKKRRFSSTSMNKKANTNEETNAQYSLIKNNLSEDSGGCKLESGEDQTQSLEEFDSMYPLAEVEEKDNHDSYNSSFSLKKVDESFLKSKLKECFVRIVRLDMQKWKPGREFLSPVKLQTSKLGTSENLADSCDGSIENSKKNGGKYLSDCENRKSAVKRKKEVCPEAKVKKKKMKKGEDGSSKEIKVKKKPKLKSDNLGKSRKKPLSSKTLSRKKRQSDLTYMKLLGDAWEAEEPISYSSPDGGPHSKSIVTSDEMVSLETVRESEQSCEVTPKIYNELEKCNSQSKKEDSSEFNLVCSSVYSQNETEQSKDEPMENITVKLDAFVKEPIEHMSIKINNVENSLQINEEVPSPLIESTTTFKKDPDFLDHNASSNNERSGRRSKRSSCGRASELASLRKAMLD